MSLCFELQIKIVHKKESLLDSSVARLSHKVYGRSNKCVSTLLNNKNLKKVAFFEQETILDVVRYHLSVNF